MRSIAVALATFALPCACADGSRVAADGAAQVGTRTQEIAAATRDTLSQGDWVVTPDGAGPVRIGMTLADLAAHLPPAVDTAAVDDRCDYVQIADAPDSVGFMIEGRRLARIDVWGGDTPTAEGARIGDAEERVLALYPSARREPHKYTDGYYLVVQPHAPEDTTRRYVFETDGRRVTTYRAGVHPQVGWVEGCS